jgi:dCTP deaminase
MIVNGKALLFLAPIVDMFDKKISHNGVSHGMSEAGYDIRIKQTIILNKNKKFSLASSIEEFNMPVDMMGVVHDKSTWARRGLSVFNTVIENGWKGYLTLELVYHGEDELVIPAGSGIAQVIFQITSNDAQYSGKYQYQENEPVKARESI